MKITEEYLINNFEINKYKELVNTEEYISFLENIFETKRCISPRLSKYSFNYQGFNIEKCTYWVTNDGLESYDREDGAFEIVDTPNTLEYIITKFQKDNNTKERSYNR